MFGGLCFLCRGNMACGIVGEELMVRVGPEAWPDALSQPHARAMDFTGRSMNGMVYVGVDGVRRRRRSRAMGRTGNDVCPFPPAKAIAEENTAKGSDVARTSTAHMPVTAR